MLTKFRGRNTAERKLRLLDKFKCYSDLQGIITEHDTALRGVQN